MRYIIVALLMIMCCDNAKANEWVPYAGNRPTPYVQPLIPIYYYSPQILVVPVAPQPIQYVPITTYSNVVVERPVWCLFKRYDIVPVANTVYLPVNPMRPY